MRVVIMGSGRTGSRLAKLLDQANHDVTVVDWNPAALARLDENFGGRTVLGNAVDQDVLKQADIASADAFVAGTSGDNRNIMAGQIAQHVFHVPKVIVRIKDPIRAEIYAKLGLEIDCRTVEGTRVILGLAGE